MTDTKELQFDVELHIEKPVLKDGRLDISGNFTETGARIKALVERYKGTELTDDNVAYVKSLKKQFVSLRTGIERERKEYKSAYIKPAEALVDSMCAELQAVVAEGEKALGEQLDAYDMKRKEELTVILKDYVEDSAKRHSLRDEYKAQIVLLDKYYNKTQAEEDSADDIEAQAEALEKKQAEYDTSVKLIRAECEDAGFLAETYIRELTHKTAQEILLEIKEDKKLKEEKVSKDGDVTVGQELTDELKKALSLDGREETEELRTRILKITYPSSKAQAIAAFFKEQGIDFEFINTGF